MKAPDLGEVFLHKGQLFRVHSWAKPNPEYDPSYSKPEIKSDADFVQHVKNLGKTDPHLHATRAEATHVHGVSDRSHALMEALVRTLE